ncbi:MAG: endolytic transglycosylase MltG [Microgenomates group bacterium]
MWLFFLGVTVGGFFWWQKGIKPVTSSLGKQEVKKTFVVKKGEDVTSIAKRLEEEGLINDRFVFQLLVFLKGLKGKIQAGSFTLSSSLSPEEIALTLTRGTNDIWITFPEGWRKEEFARRLKANLENFEEKKFLDLTNKLEGYLFPDTYLFPKNIDEEKIVKILKENFDKKAQPFLDEEKESLTSYEKLILASIIEREVKYPEDREIAAGILIKRLKNNWPLQTDATIQYAKVNLYFSPELFDSYNWWPVIKKEDLKIDSPYNTYKYKNLPPTPICNPGLASIKAVIYAKDSEFWYYLSDKKGKLHFARTLEEHQENINKFLDLTD